MRQQLVFKALADPTRRLLLKRLQDGALTAGELGEGIAMSAASLSHHLGLLKQAELVRVERRGQFQLYSLNSSVMEDALRLVMDLLPAPHRARVP
ncbi:metalloregulator ArsR/SmtB family transcription factor [Frateuria aurantia]